ncbi:MAG: VOC family protein [Candidatus Krumholzibacteria bacterium]
MSQEEQERRIDYIEFPSTDPAQAKKFYSGVFGWVFTDYGPDYTSFSDGRLAGGFRTAKATTQGGPLTVIYAKDLKEMAAKISECGGKITKEPFDFPGGSRFHFTDPDGNELAVWSDQ